MRRWIGIGREFRGKRLLFIRSLLFWGYLCFRIEGSGVGLGD
jgi:hypothetical protein